MDKKLIFFDIDGTLIPEGDTEITKSAVEAIKRAQENGHLCFINTGRPIGTVSSNIMDVSFDGYICGCGTYITYHDREILHVGLEEEIIAELIRWNQKEKIDIFFEGPDGLTFPPESSFKDLSFVEDYFRSQNVNVRYFSYNAKVDFCADKFSMWFDEKNPPLAFRTFLDQKFSVIERGKDFWEVIPKGYSKATGIDDLLDYLGMDLADTISIGDSANDIAMLEHTGQSVLMGNGTPELKQMVTYVTADIEEDGVYQALKHFQLI